MVKSRGQWRRIVFLDGSKFSEGANLRISWALDVLGEPATASSEEKEVADYNVSSLVAEEI